jgi:hypothetical protein
MHIHLLDDARAAMPAKLFGLLFLLSVCAPAAAQPLLPADDIAVRIERLIGQLGDEAFERREAASKDLAAIGHRTRSALERATKSSDPEVAGRAKAILDGLPRLTHTLVDALGLPIPRARMSVTIATLPLVPFPGGEPPPGAQPDRVVPQIISATTEDDGRFGLPSLATGGVSASATVEHPDYGLARCEIDASGRQTVLRLPLVRRGTEAYRRAVSGRVVTADGKPVAGAIVHGFEVRTPGEGLINGLDPRGQSLTDEDGQFAYYLPNENRNRERGELIPANSRYRLTITVPGDDSFFPIAGRYANLEPVRIELPQNTRFHRFRFEAVGGGWLGDPKQLAQVHVQLDSRQAGERMLVPLERSSVTAGRKLVPGTYLAEYFPGGKTVDYLPLVVTADSPEELTFELPHSVSYVGRVVHGVTGKPMAGALVMGYRSTSRNNLALLTDDDWKMLREVPSNPPLDHPAVKRLGEFYGVQGLVRTDDEGRFEITRQPDQEFYGVIAFDRDAIGFNVRLGSLKPDENHRVDAGEFPLFPAAKILVKPVFAGERLSVLPQWLPTEAGQPDWYGRFQTAKTASREFEYVHWLALNELQPVFVPAGVRLQVRFDTPYDDQWAPAMVEEVLLEPGISKEIGELRFAACLPGAVRVVDSRGKPVEGAPVRRMYQGDDGWCVAHNTDSQGLAHFHLRPNSEGKFWVSDLPGPQEVRMAENLLTGFKVGDAAPTEQPTITLTDAQIKLLLGAKRGPPGVNE